MKKIATWATGFNLLLVLVALNILFSFYPLWRWDLTKNKIHSLSPASREMIKNLDDVVNIDVYLSQDLPGEVKPAAQSLKILLEEFYRLNKSKIRIKYFDPIKDKKAEEEAQRLGINPLQFSTVKSDKFEVSNAYFGLALAYEDKELVLPVAGDVGNMEYFLVSGLKNLFESEKKKVVLIEEPSLTGETEVGVLRQFLTRNYQLIEGDWGKELNQEAQVLVIIGAKNGLPDGAGEKIKDWLKAGKGLVVLAERIVVNQSMQWEEAAESELWKILAEAGIKIKKGLVWDESSAIANFQTPNGMFLTRYPYWLQIRQENIDSSLPPMSGIETVMLPWAGAMEVDKDAKILFSSSQKSRWDEKLTNLAPGKTEADNLTQTGKQAVAAVNTKGMKLAVVADSDFVKDMFVNNNRANLFLALNLIDYMAADESLLQIRAKTIASSPIKMMEESQKTIVKAVNLVLPLVLLAGAGLILNLIRKRQNQKWVKA